MDEAAGTEAGFEAAGEEAEGCVDAGWVEVSEARRMDNSGCRTRDSCCGRGREGERKVVEDLCLVWMGRVLMRVGWSLRVWRAQRRWREGGVAMVGW